MLFGMSPQGNSNEAEWGGMSGSKEGERWRRRKRSSSVFPTFQAHPKGGWVPSARRRGRGREARRGSASDWPKSTLNLILALPSFLVSPLPARHARLFACRSIDLLGWDRQVSYVHAHQRRFGSSDDEAM